MNRKMSEKARLPKLLVPITRKLMNIFKRGDWRMGLRPSYQTKTAPCQANCPAGNDIRGWLAWIVNKNFYEAIKLLSKTNPLPTVCGLICPHPCESNCNRKDFNEAIAINLLEQLMGFIRTPGEMSGTSFTKPPKRWYKKKTAIVGSGPAGLSCAWQLLNRGWKVTIFEKSKIGGILTQAIPEFRLPKGTVSSEIDIILRRGAEVKTEIEVGRDVTLDQLQAEYDAIFIATGAHKSRLMNIVGEQAIIPGLSFLEDIENWKNCLAKHWRVVVIGGGNTAIDAARSAKKYGSDIVTVVYRRSEKEMPAQKSEIEEAKKEGINFIFLAAPEEIQNTDEIIKTLVCRKMTLGEPDESGRKKPVPTNATMLVGATLIISAIGEEPNLDSIIGPFGYKSTEEKQQAIEIMELQGIFIGGDALTGPSYVAQAIGQGREAAEKIIAYFRGRPYRKPEKPPVILAENLNLAYFKNADRQPIAGPMDAGFADSIRKEAARCFSCGLCPQDPETCKNCWQFCPDISIEFKNGKFEINLDYCKGCLICSQECPRHVINVEEEKKE